MPRMIVSIDSVVIKEVELTKERTTLSIETIILGMIHSWFVELLLG